MHYKLMGASLCTAEDIINITTLVIERAFKSYISKNYKIHFWKHLKFTLLRSFLRRDAGGLIRLKIYGMRNSDVVHTLVSGL
jgi:hypothetical protein